MNQSEPRQIENDLRHMERRHPVDFLEPLPGGNESTRQTCEVFSRTLVWIADGSTLGQVGLRATVVLYCVCADFIGGANPRRNRPTSRFDGLPVAAVRKLGCLSRFMG